MAFLSVGNSFSLSVSNRHNPVHEMFTFLSSSVPDGRTSPLTRDVTFLELFPVHVAIELRINFVLH